MVPQPDPTHLQEGGNTENVTNSRVGEQSDEESNSDSDTINGDEYNLVIDEPPSIKLEGTNIVSDVEVVGVKPIALSLIHI